MKPLLDFKMPEQAPTLAKVSSKKSNGVMKQKTIKPQIAKETPPAQVVEQKPKPKPVKKTEEEEAEEQMARVMAQFD
jgi:hypothetical protein